MEETLIQNLQVLRDSDKFLSNQFKISNLSFTTSEDEVYDQIYTPEQLEYPIYFTFHELIHGIHKTYTSTFQGYTRCELLEQLDEAVDVLFEYYSNLEEENPRFEHMIEGLDYKIHFLKLYSRYGWCYYLPLWCKETLNSFCSSVIQKSVEIAEAYVREIKDPGSYSDEEDFRNKNSSSTNDSDDSDDSVDSKKQD